MKKIIFFILLPMIIILFFIMIVYMVVVTQNNNNQIKPGFQFSSEVEDCRDEVNKNSVKYLNYYIGIDKNNTEEIEKFNNLFLAQIQVHFDNEIKIGQDAMYISNYNAHYRNCSECKKNQCKNKHHSISYGIKTMCNLFKNEGVKKVNKKYENKIKNAFVKYFNEREENTDLYHITQITSNDYKSNIWFYYQSYMSVQNNEIVGKGRDSMVKFALTQVGTGGKDSWQYNNVTGGHWCTYFCIMCAGKADLTKAKELLHPYVPTVVNNFRVKGLYHSVNSGYKPIRGDFVIRYGYGHIGIVVSRTGNAVETVEGNTGGVGSGANFWNTSSVHHYYGVTNLDGYCTY